jgi:RNA polymerase sigma-32 factor
MQYYDKDTQTSLLKRWRNKKDASALNLLIRSNEKMIASMAHKIRGANRGVEIDDLIQEGFLGMLRAAETYDFDSQASFSTYASYAVRNRISRFIMANKGSMKIGTTKDCRTLYQKYPPLARKLDETGMSEDEKCRVISEKLGVKIASVYKFKNIVCKVNKSLDDSVAEGVTLGGMIESDMNTEDDVSCLEVYSKFFGIIEEMRADELSDLETAILDFRYMTDDVMTYDNLAKKVGFSRPTVFNAEKKLMAKIKKRVIRELGAQKEDFGL